MNLSISSIIILTNIVFFSLFVISILVKIGIPIHLSVTYYVLETKHRWLRWIFPFLLFIMCSTVGPVWIDMTTIYTWFDQLIFLPYTTIFCLLAVVASTQYQKSRKLIYFHYTCAIIASVCTAAWLFLIAYRIIYIGLSILFIELFAGWYTNSLKVCYLFWLETAAFYALLITLFVLSIIPINI